MDNKQITYQCKCGKVLSLELKTPLVLWKNHPKRALCSCGRKLPKQKQRDILFKNQNEIEFGCE